MIKWYGPELFIYRLNGAKSWYEARNVINKFNNFTYSPYLNVDDLIEGLIKIYL